MTLRRPNEAPLFSERAAVAQHQLRGGQSLGEVHHFVPVASRECTAIGDTGVVPVVLGEPESSHVLDTVECDAARHAVPSTVIVDRA